MLEKYLIETYGEFLEKLYIYENKTSVKLSTLVIKEDFRNKGVGSDLMKVITSYADENTKAIFLSPKSDYGSTIERLTKFYESFGFVKNVISGYGETMVRFPRVKSIKEGVKLNVSDETPENISVVVEYNGRNAGIITIAPSPTKEDVIEIVEIKFKKEYSSLQVISQGVKGLWNTFKNYNSIIVAPKIESVNFWNKLGFSRISPNYLILNRGH